MDPVDKFGRIFTEEIGEDIVAVSTPKTFATVLGKYNLNEIGESENELADFAELAATIRETLASSLLGDERHPKISDEKAQKIDIHSRMLLKKIENESKLKYTVDGIHGVGKTYLIYVLNVPSCLEACRRKLDLTEEERTSYLFSYYTRAILEYIEENVHGITADKGNIPYIR